jgi:hypothetical protein
MGGAYSTHDVYRNLVRKPEGIRPTGRSRKDNIRMDLSEIGWEVAHCIEVAQDSIQWRAVVNTVMNLQVP